MGIAGAYLPAAVSVFPVAAVLALPALLSVTLIGTEGAQRAVLRPLPSDQQRQDDARITWQGMKCRMDAPCAIMTDATTRSK